MERERSGKIGERENRHWAEVLAERVVKEKEPPYVVLSGITTSGPCHLGTLCEFLFPSAIHKYISREHEARFIFIADIMDAFDSVPVAMKEHERSLIPELGKPLCNVLDPLGCHNSFGEHFLMETVEIMQEFGVSPEIMRANEMYAAGMYDRYAKMFMESQEEMRKLVFETSLRKDSGEYWSPLMPICEKCGKMATTRVLEWKSGAYRYECVGKGEIEGCGHVGEGRIEEHEYKVTWRLDWPSRQDFLHASIEGAGVDHMTRGGSWDTAKAVHKRIFCKEPPIGYKFGFILFKGKKYSKSKGEGMGVRELLSLVPPEIIKYALFRPDLEENIDFDPSGYKLIDLYNDFLYASSLSDNGGLSRADRKKLVAFQLACESKLFSAQFTDFLLYYQLYKNWEKVGELIGDKEGAKNLQKYIENWIKEGYAPEEYSFSFNPQKPSEEVKKFVRSLQEGMSAVEIHNSVFKFARENGMEPSELFKMLYMALIGKERGPRMGRLIEAIGIKEVKRALLE
ncbi:MAG: lysine--tRNA ligase [Candidatus Micrarchaeia archaeon]